MRLSRNCGKASALRLGIEFARTQNFTHVITLDGDGQHLPQDIPGLLRVAEETGADLVIGTAQAATGAGGDVWAASVGFTSPLTRS